MGLSGAPLVPLATAVAAGIALAPWLALSSPALIAAAGVPLLAGGAALACRLERLAALCLLASLVALGALRESGSPLPANHVARLTLPAPVAIEGRLASEPIHWAIDRTRLLVEVEAYQDGLDRRPASGLVQLAIYGAAPALGEGQGVSAEVRLYRPIGLRNPGAFDYPAQLRREGILLVGSGRGDRIVPLGPDAPPWPVTVKRWAVDTIRSGLPEASAALLAGLLLGERVALPKETDEAFRRAGVYHILAVSGFNVALLASSVFATLALVGASRRAAALCAAAVIVGFALVVGGQPSVVRATVMGLVLLGSVLLEREAQVMNALALAAIILLAWRPGDLRDPGFQLSFAATAGIVYLGPSLMALLHERGWPSWLAGAVAVSLGAQLAITPIMLAHFNQLSLIGVLANLFAVPLAAPATMLGLLALLASLISETVGGLLFNALWLLVLVLRGVVWAAAAIPLAMLHLPAPTWAVIVAWYIALLLAPQWRRHRLMPAATAACAVAAAALSLWPWVAPGDGRLRVTFLDVGQGDATLIELPRGPRILIDGGPGGARRFDVGERVLSPYLWNRPARRLDVVALSHPDVDHAGGLAAILRHFEVGEFWENGSWSAGAEETRRVLERSGIPRRVLRAGDRLWVGDALVAVLNPDDRAAENENDNSLVLRLDWRAVSLLLTGDLGGDGEARVRERGGALRALALKVAHHGSRFSSTSPFLEAARPALAIISAGPRNPFRHPTPEALARLEAVGARIYRTDRDGAIILESDGVTLQVTRWASGAREVFGLDARP